MSDSKVEHFVIASMHSAARILVTESHGLKRVPEQHRWEAHFDYVIEPHGAANKLAVVFADSVSDLDLTSFGLPAAQSDDEKMAYLSSAAIGEYLDKYGVPSAPPTGVCEIPCPAEQIQEWKSRTRADERTVLEYLQNTMYGAWYFELDYVAFDGADLIRLRASARWLGEIAELKRDIYWHYAFMHTKALVLRPLSRISELKIATTAAVSADRESHGVRQAPKTAPMETPTRSRKWRGFRVQPLNLADPVGLFRTAMREVPATKWALGVAGLAAAVTIVFGWRFSPFVVVLGVVVLLVLMVGLLAFSVLASAPGMLAIPALAFAWVCIALVSVTGVLLVSVTFWGRPTTWQIVFAQVAPGALVTGGALIPGSHPQAEEEQRLTTGMRNYFEGQDWTAPEPGQVMGLAKGIVARFGTDSHVFASVQAEIERRKKEDPNWTYANRIQSALALVQALGLSPATRDNNRVFLDMVLPSIPPKPAPTK